jgi:hypothetical protein
VREDIIKIGRKNIKLKYIDLNHLNADRVQRQTFVVVTVKPQGSYRAKHLFTETTIVHLNG